jgi:vesicle coat complex subunit
LKQGNIKTRFGRFSKYDEDPSVALSSGSDCCEGDTLQNCTVELATLGDLKLVEKPQPVVLAPHDFCNIKANVKVASTENGIIFGNIGEC